MSKPSYYAIITAEVRYDKTLAPMARLLYAEITALCNDRGYCWANNEYFSRIFECSHASVTNWVKALEKGGYIRTEVRKEEGNKRYVFLSPIQNNLGSYPKNRVDTTQRKGGTPTRNNLGNNNININTKNNTKENRDDLSYSQNEFREISKANKENKPNKESQVHLPTERELDLLSDFLKVDREKLKNNIKNSNWLCELIYRCNKNRRLLSPNKYDYNNLKTGTNAILKENSDLTIERGILIFRSVLMDKWWKTKPFGLKNWGHYVGIANEKMTEKKRFEWE